MTCGPGGARTLAGLASCLALTLLLGGCMATTQDRYLLGNRLPEMKDLPFTEADAETTRLRQPEPVPAPAEVMPAPAIVVPSRTEIVQPALPAPGPGLRVTGVWARLQAGNGVPALPDALAGDLVREYASRPDFLSRAMQRSAPYLRHIVDELERQGMPAELALLPVIESGFDPRAMSPAAASGIWQFIPETGRRYGLRLDWLRDERRDPLAATSAALAYLGDLYRRFGDWHLALAAYNCGEGCVTRAMERARAAGRAPDFAGIVSWLPAETQAYVPRFVAVRTIFRNPAAHGVALPPVDQAARIVRHRMDRDADLASVARLAGASTDEITQLNAGVLRQVVVGDERFVWLTEAQSVRLTTALSRQPTGAALQLKPVQAKPQEKLGSFAARHNIDVTRLRSINGIPASLSTIRSGTLFVPLDIDEPAAPVTMAALAPLRMQGEEDLAEKRISITRDEELLARHPDWVESGWSPSRLQLPGRRAQRR